ncbi:hypothetical protein RchiOBHm_Chr7g0185331 [Rosa chinensis]|uniref:Uncharacterized protein n=1 Tax=Rosa chinensis TaxID=74649 RepID=A0A2P6P3N6_ROSCH|nr:hypothetical protein RchiOBHm_Chr7g0185331 [Rosa chinensis]
MTSICGQVWAMNSRSVSVISFHVSKWTKFGNLVNAARGISGSSKQTGVMTGLDLRL